MKLILAAALAALLAPLPAAAQDWYRISDSDIGVQYVDLASIKPDGDYLLASEFMALKTPMRGFSFVATTIRYDCKARLVGLVRMEAFKSKTESTGPIPDAEQPLEAVTAGSPGDAALTFVCNVDRKGGVRVQDPWTDKP